MSAACRIEECEKSVRAKSLCAMHYTRLVRRGSTDKLPLPNFVEPKVRFWAKVDKTDTCWLWTGGKGFGYGNFWIDGRNRFAHVVAYEWLVGKVVEGLELDHLCRVRACVNPAHLEPVTHQENIRRAPKNMVTECPKGHPYDEENTRMYRGKRNCIACSRARPRTPRKKERGQEVALRKGGWVHASCVNGADDQ